MTGLDILELAPGDSVIGFRGDWTDEFPIVEVGALAGSGAGCLRRRIVVRAGAITLPGMVREGDATWRGARTRDVS